MEGTVGIISTFILAALRNRQFLSLPELNEAIWERLEAFNNKPFQKKNGSRASLFAEEKPFLRPLPPYPFELATWKKATVGPNYHISVERMNYSVPFEYIRQKVDVRLTRATVEVFYNGLPAKDTRSHLPTSRTAVPRPVRKWSPEVSHSSAGSSPPPCT